MRIRYLYIVAAVLLLVTLWFGWSDSTDSLLTKGRVSNAALSKTVQREPLLALPLPVDADILKTSLGERLFFDKRLSRDDSIACAGCHDFSRGGADGMAVSIGIDGKKGTINAPTVFNTAFNFVQFWDGRAANLEEQAAGPVHNPLEMGANWAMVIPKLEKDAAYRQSFSQLYPKEGISGKSIVDAIAAYERTLITYGSRFDRYMAGDQTALKPEEIKGYQKFLDFGCASCHQGVGVGGNMYSRFGILDDYFKNRPLTEADMGRYNVTKREEDRYVFKVPILRNVTLTAPYFHDASAKTLRQAVIIMGRYQLGQDLKPEDVESLIAFLGTLTGQWQGQYLQ